MHLLRPRVGQQIVFLEKSDLGLLSVSVGMGVSRGEQILQFALKTEACASSHGLLQFLFDKNAFSGIT